MPLTLSNRDQNSGHLFYQRRLRAAITRFSVRMKHDDRKQQAALTLSIVFVLIGCGWMALLHMVKPAGLSGQAAIVGNRETGSVYARIDGRLYPALNLTSARLVTGDPGEPTWVRGQEIDRYPTGPMIGIAGVPDEIAARPTPVSAFALCDTAPPAGGTAPEVTAIAGELAGRGRAAPLAQSRAILAGYGSATYLIWNGRRTPVDIADRAVRFTLGLDAVAARSRAVSHALFDALPATEPLVVPQIPSVGNPSRWLGGVAVGRILVTQDVHGSDDGFYVVLPGGIQKVSAFVADLLRAAANRAAAGPHRVSPADLVDIPQVHELAVDSYPDSKPAFVDDAVDPVVCVSWRKRSSDRQADVTVLSGPGLPTPQALDTHIVRLVRDSRGADSVEAQQVLIQPGAATFVASTGAALDSGTREALYWLSPRGVRFGVAADQETTTALGLDPRSAVQAPWPMLRSFAPGPMISRAGALVARDTIDPSGRTAPLPSNQSGGR